jgi:hypothetical protein
MQEKDLTPDEIYVISNYRVARDAHFSDIMIKLDKGEIIQFHTTIKKEVPKGMAKKFKD